MFLATTDNAASACNALPCRVSRREKARLAVAEKLEQIELPAGYSLQWQGEKNASDQSMKYLFKNFPLAIILMIAILIMLFKDYRKPAIIFCSIPMVFVGVVMTMLVTRQDVQLCRHCRDIGVDRNDHKERYRADGRDHFADRAGDGAGHRLIDSAQSRLRPVMMAALTTILG